MERKKLAQDNYFFYQEVVRAGMHNTNFSKTVVESLLRKMAVPYIDEGDFPYCINIDSFGINKKGVAAQNDFIEALYANIFLKVANQIPQIKKEGLNTEIRIVVGNYQFVFHIFEYERDSKHNFKRIDEDYVSKIPDDEKLVRQIHLDISLVDE